MMAVLDVDIQAGIAKLSLLILLASAQSHMHGSLRHLPRGPREQDQEAGGPATPKIQERRWWTPLWLRGIWGRPAKISPHRFVIQPSHCPANVLGVNQSPTNLVPGRRRLHRIVFSAAVGLVTLAGPIAWAQPADNASNAATATPRELRFQDFFTLPVGPKGLEISPALHQANGQEVTLTGYMVQQEAPTPGEFLLTPRPVQMSEHADGDADDLPPATVRVLLAPAQRAWAVPHVRGLVRLTGQLAVGRLEGSDGRVSWVRLQLAPEAARGMNATELADLQREQAHAH